MKITAVYFLCHASMTVDIGFKYLATQKSIDSHFEKCPLKPGNFGPIAAEVGRQDCMRNVEDDKEKLANFYAPFENVIKYGGGKTLGRKTFPKH